MRPRMWNTDDCVDVTLTWLRQHRDQLDDIIAQIEAVRPSTHRERTGIWSLDHTIGDRMVDSYPLTLEEISYPDPDLAEIEANSAPVTNGDRQ